MLPKVSDFLTAEQVEELRGKSDVAGALLVMHAWALIAASMVLFAWWPNPFTFLLGVMVIGGRQLGLAILMHDAAHGLLFANRRLNDGLATWLCAWPVFTSLALYRPYHLQHHRFTQQAEKGSLSMNVLLFAVLAAAGYWWLYPVMWLLPLATWYQLISRIRNIAEHAVVPDNDDPLRNTRTTQANPLERLLLAPYWVNYHLEHHLFMFVPCWRLPAAHQALLAAGRKHEMELQPSYLAVLRLATSRVADSTGRPGSRGTAQHI